MVGRPCGGDPQGGFDPFAGGRRIPQRNLWSGSAEDRHSAPDRRTPFVSLRRTEVQVIFSGNWYDISAAVAVYSRDYLKPSLASSIASTADSGPAQSSKTEMFRV